MSGNKRHKAGSGAAGLKVTSPQRSDKVTLGTQGSASKLDRQRQINDIIGHLKNKNSAGPVTVKISQKGLAGKNAGVTSGGSTVTPGGQSYVGIGSSGLQTIKSGFSGLNQKPRDVGLGNLSGGRQQ